MFLRFCVRGFGKKERNALSVDFEDTPNSLTEHGTNQNVGIKHQGLALHADYVEFRFFSRVARRISLYSPMSSSSDAPQVAIIASRSFAAARMASTSALRLRFCAGIKKPSVSPWRVIASGFPLSR